MSWLRGRDPEEAAYCEAAGALHADPYAIDEESERTIGSSAQLFAGEPLAEFLAGARSVDTSSLIEWIAAVERRCPEASLAPALSEAADAASENLPEEGEPHGWTIGYRAARAFRTRLGLGSEWRFATYGELAIALGASAKFEPAPAAAGLRLIKTVADDGVHLHLRSHGRTDVANASQLFALARGVGDALCFPRTRRSAVNDLRSAYRQAVSRAFAAEFLAPIAEIRSMAENGYDLVAIADEFAVSTEVVERQLENANGSSSACA